MKNTMPLTIVVSMISSCVSCSAPPLVHHDVYDAKIVNERSEPIREATVVPLVSKRFGLRIGPDGKGPESEPKFGFDEPFLWNSGDSLYPVELHSSAIMILPMVGSGRDVLIHDWIVILKGYHPLIITNQKARIDYKGGAVLTAKKQIAQPFIMKKGGDIERRSIITALTAEQPDFERVNKILDSDINYLAISEAGKTILKKQH